MVDKHDPASLQIGAITGNTFTSNQIDKIFDVVVNGPKDQNRSMTEETFKSYFLPVLAGAIEDLEVLRLYTRGAGGPNVGVNITDALGNFLYEVPPLLSTQHIKAMPDDINAVTFSTIIENVEMMRRRSPAQADGMFKNGIYQRLLKSHDKTYKPTVNEARWVEIFKKYGYEVKRPELLSKENHDQATSINKNASSGTDAGTTSDIETNEEY